MGLFDDSERRLANMLSDRIPAAGEYLTARVYDAAPKRTGKMASSIHFERSGPLSVKVIAEYYAPFVEFGTSSHTAGEKRKKGGKHKKNYTGRAAHPFMHPTIEREAPNVLRIMAGESL